MKDKKKDENKSSSKTKSKDNAKEKSLTAAIKNEFLEYLRADGKVKKTIASYTGDINGFLDYLENKGINFDGKITRFFVTQYKLKNEQSQAPSYSLIREEYRERITLRVVLFLISKVYNAQDT